MKYTYQQVEGQSKQFLVTADNNGQEVIFTVGIASDEAEIDDLVKFHLDFLNGDKTPKDNYATKRQNEYPSVVNQLDILYHGGYDVWKAQIQAIKDKYPKPIEPSPDNNQ